MGLFFGMEEVIFIIQDVALIKCGLFNLHFIVTLIEEGSILLDAVSKQRRKPFSAMETY